VPLGREQLEQLARPILDRTVTATMLALTSAGLTPQRLAAVFLVGGSSRIPLAATLLHRAFGTSPTAIEQPELVVAEGALALAPRAGRAVVGPPVAGQSPAATSGPAGPAGGGGVAGAGLPAPVSGVPGQVSGIPSAGLPAGPASGGPWAGGQPGGAPPPDAQPQGPTYTLPHTSPAPAGQASGGGPVSGGPAAGGALWPQGAAASGGAEQSGGSPNPYPPGPSGVQPGSPGGFPVSSPPVSGPPVFGPTAAGSSYTTNPPVSGPPQGGHVYGSTPVSGPSVSGPPIGAQPVATPHRGPTTGGPTGYPGPSTGAPAGPPTPTGGHAPTQPPPTQPPPTQPPPPGYGAAQPGAAWQAARPHQGPTYPAYPQRPAPPQNPPTVAQAYPQPRPQVVPTQTMPAAGLNQAVAPEPPGRRRLLIAGLIAACLLLVAVVGGVGYALLPDKSRPKPQVPIAACGYKIAYLGVLSGDNTQDGQTVRNSAKLAVDGYNTAHPSCTAELAEFDTEGDDDVAVQKANELAKDEKILGVVGPVWDAEADQAMPVLDGAGVPVTSPSLPEVDLTGHNWKTFHRTTGNDSDQAAASARYLTSTMRAQRVFIVADSDASGIAYSQELRLKLNTAYTSRADIEGNEKDYAAVVTQITQSNADVLYLAAYYDAAGLLVKQLRNAGSTIKVMGWDRMFSPAFVNGAGPNAAEGAVITCPCLPPSEAKNNFANTYKEKFGDAGYFAPEAFDAANVYLDGLAAGKSTRAKMLEFMAGYDHEGVSHRIKFKPSGDLDAAPVVWAYKVQSGSVYKDQAVATA
jgi:branched-chain amino acid transport system substrate-binding protein